jgi:hypothetical protein
MAHEVFHVFQAVMSGTLANFNRPNITWLVEGSAAWVESDLVSDDTGARANWAAYFTQPGVPLFSLSYPAIGFFGHLASNGVDLWKRFPAIFATTSNTAAYRIATLGTPPAFLQDEASVFFRDPSLGLAWDQQGQQYVKFANENVPAPGEEAFYGLTPFHPRTITFSAGDPSTYVPAAPYANTAVKLVVHLKSAEPFLIVTVISGNARLHAAEGEGNVDAVDPVQVSYCADSGGCSCPGNNKEAAEVFLQGDLAITGGPTGGMVKLSAGGCDLLPRLCIGLLPTSDFSEPAVPDGYSYTQGPLYEELSGNPGQCDVQYKMTASDGSQLGTGLVGIFALVTYANDADAHKAFETLLKSTGWDTADAPVAGIGDEAYIGDGEGALRVRNDVFDVDWLRDPPSGSTVQQVMQDVVETLTS